MARLEGVFCPAVTFFDAQGGLDVATFEEHLHHLMDAGLQGVVPLGTMGEFTLLTDAERRTLAEASVHAVGGKGKVIVGTGSPSTDTAGAPSLPGQDVGAGGVGGGPPF